MSNTSESTGKTGKDLDTLYTIELVTPEDNDALLAHCRKNFFKDEPISAFLKMGECKEFEDYAVKTLHERCSFKAVNQKGEIIGALIRATIKRPLPGTVRVRHATNCTHPKFKKLLELMDYTDDHFNIFDLYPDVDVLLDGILMSVDSSYRGLGIARRLTERVIEYMRKHNIPVMKAFCSSAYSTQVYHKLGFTEVYTLPYADYKVNGVAELALPYPHVAARVLAIKIDLKK